MCNKLSNGIGAAEPGRRSKTAVLGLLVAAMLLSAAAPAHAYDRGGWHGGGWGWGLGVGLATGLAFDAALGWPRYYYPYPYAAYP